MKILKIETCNVCPYFSPEDKLLDGTVIGICINEDCAAICINIDDSGVIPIWCPLEDTQ